MSGIGGQLIGLGKGREDSASIEWLKNPVHNRIVHGGIEHLLTFGGSTDILYKIPTETTSMVSGYSTVNPWVGNMSQSGYEQKGALYYCAYGNGEGSTGFYDTDLKNRLAITATKYVGAPYCGSKFGYANSSETMPSLVYHRISHKFNVVNETTIIKEIGWFGSTQDGYVMFSRVALDTPYTLNAGEYLVCTYELTETYNSNVVNIPSTYLSTVSATSRIYRLTSGNGNAWGKPLNCPSISVSGTANNAAGLSWSMMGYAQFPAYACYYNDASYVALIKLSSSPSLPNSINSTPSSSSNGNTVVATTKPYIRNSYCREIANIQYDASGSSYSKLMIAYNGTAYLFDYTSQFASCNFRQATFRLSYSTPDTVKVLNGETPDL